MHGVISLPDATSYDKLSYNKKTLYFENIVKTNLYKGIYLQCLKFFRKARKKRYKEYREQIISSLDYLNDNNPKAYKSLLGKLKNADKDSNVDPVSEDMWYTYFKELNTSDNTNIENPLVDTDLPNLDNIKKFQS